MNIRKLCRLADKLETARNSIRGPQLLGRIEEPFTREELDFLIDGVLREIGPGQFCSGKKVMSSDE